MLKNLFLISCSIFTLFSTSCHSTEKEEIGFLPKGDVYSIHRNDADLTASIKVRNVDGSYRHEFTVQSASDIFQLLISSDEKYVVGMDESLGIKRYDLDTMNDPLYLAPTICKIPYEHQSYIKLLGIADDVLYLFAKIPLLQAEQSSKQAAIQEKINIISNEIQALIDEEFEKIEETFSQLTRERDLKISEEQAKISADIDSNGNTRYSIWNKYFEQYQSIEKIKEKEISEKYDSERNLLNEKREGLYKELTSLNLITNLTHQTKLVSVNALTGKMINEVLINPDFEVKHGTLTKDHKYLVIDNRHPMQKHATHFGVINLENASFKEIVLSDSKNISFLDLEMRKIKVRGNSVYFLTYAGKENNYNRVVQYHLDDEKFSQFYQSDAYDVVGYNLTQDQSSGHFLLNDSGKIIEQTFTNNNGQLILSGPITYDPTIGKVLTNRKYSPVNSKIRIDVFSDLNNQETVKTKFFVTPENSFELKSKKRSGKTLYTAKIHTTQMDNLNIPSFSYHPQQVAENSSPLIVNLHGGPFSHSEIGHSNLVNYLTELGYTVLDINFPGSTGYGKNYAQKLIGNYGGIDADAVKTCIDDFVKKTPTIDKNHVYISGHSYGGYLSVIMALRYPESAAGFIASGGYYNWGNENPLYVDSEKFNLSKEEADLRLNPSKYAGNIQKPLLLLHGYKDDICYFNESEKIYNAALFNNPFIELLPLQSDHFYKEKSVQAQVAQKIKEFVEKNRQNKQSSEYAIITQKEASPSLEKETVVFDLD